MTSHTRVLLVDNKDDDAYSSLVLPKQTSSHTLQCVCLSSQYNLWWLTFFISVLLTAFWHNSENTFIVVYHTVVNGISKPSKCYLKVEQVWSMVWNQRIDAFVTQKGLLQLRNSTYLSSPQVVILNFWSMPLPPERSLAQQSTVFKWVC